MRQENIAILPLQTAATVTSAAIDSRNLLYCSVQITASSGGGGTLQLQASNDISGEDGKPGPAANWSNVPSGSVSVTGAGAFLIPTTTICYQQLRVVYTNSGSGTISAIFKALGA